MSELKTTFLELERNLREIRLRALGDQSLALNEAGWKEKWRAKSGVR